MIKEKVQWCFDIAVYATIHIVAIAVVCFIIYGAVRFWLGA